MDSQTTMVTKKSLSICSTMYGEENKTKINSPADGFNWLSISYGFTDNDKLKDNNIK